MLSITHIKIPQKEGKVNGGRGEGMLMLNLGVGHRCHNVILYCSVHLK